MRGANLSLLSRAPLSRVLPQRGGGPALAVPAPALRRQPGPEDQPQTVPRGDLLRDENTAQLGHQLRQVLRPDEGLLGPQCLPLS
jgi:hypothetical protein